MHDKKNTLLPVRSAAELDSVDTEGGRARQHR